MSQVSLRSSSLFKASLVFAFVSLSYFSFAGAAFSGLCTDCFKSKKEDQIRKVATWTQNICKHFQKKDPTVICEETSIIGKDDRTKVGLNSDPKTLEMAGRTPMVQFCGNNSSTGVLTKRKGEDADYIAISAHHLFDGNGNFKKYKYDSNGNGKIDDADKEKTCSLEEFKKAYLAFNLHYLGSKYNSFGEKVEQNIMIWPPINLEKGKNFRSTGEDVLILKLNRKVSEQKMPDTNKKRGYSKFLEPGNYNVKNLTEKSSNLAFHKDTDLALMQTSKYEVVNSVNDDVGIDFKSKNDALQVSSGSAHYLSDYDQAIYALTRLGNINDKLDENINPSHWTGLMSTESLVKDYNLETTGPFDTASLKARSE